MWYVYYTHITTGKQEYVGSYDTAKGAIERIRSLYNLDRTLNQLGEYYYFMKQH